MKPILTLLTDFGRTDPWVGAVRGVLCTEWSRWPGETLPPHVVDLGHEVPRGDVEAAAWFLSYVAPEFPADTVHLAVVDPGVGGDRLPVALSAGGQIYVGPGNGLFRPILDDAKQRGENVAVVQLDNPLYRRDVERNSATFDGRDVFAPAAAHLALGVPLEQVGSPCDDSAIGQVPGQGFPAGSGAGGRRFRVRWIDRFGNAITDLERESEVGAALTAGREVEIAGARIPGPLRSYVHAEPETPFWYWGSGGTLEIAVRDGDAAARLGLERGLALYVPGL